MVQFFDNLQPPITSTELEKLVEMISEFFETYSQFMRSFRAFGKDCNDLFSGDFEMFINKVKENKPDVYEIMSFFSRHYNPKTHVLDLERLPSLVRIYGDKGAWKEKRQLSKTVSDGRQKMREAREKSKIIGAPRD
jgi:hypothetical protein